ncbi:unnamed protein product [Cuscuta epithymum]|uniref:Uncharacterized protein n=1 Tax=Cuscuta epithymum TaxID=186058 RepID=A0AAV0DR92_9ASTE|nr:unnamed protein product [Cuscuta epithymum]
MPPGSSYSRSFTPSPKLSPGLVNLHLFFFFFFFFFCAEMVAPHGSRQVVSIDRGETLWNVKMPPKQIMSCCGADHDMRNMNNPRVLRAPSAQGQWQQLRQRSTKCSHAESQATVLIRAVRGRGRSSNMIMAPYQRVGGHVMRSPLEADRKGTSNGPYLCSAGTRPVFKYDNGTVPKGRWPHNDVGAGGRSETNNQRSSSVRSRNEAGLPNDHHAEPEESVVVRGKSALGGRSVNPRVLQAPSAHNVALDTERRRPDCQSGSVI